MQGLELVEMPYSEDCCGFGGTFAAKFNMISAAMGDSKAGNAEASGAEFLTSTDPSCLMQIEGILRRRNSKVRTLHLASILAQTAENPRCSPMSEAAQEFLRRAVRNSADPRHQQIIRRATQQPAYAQAKARFHDWEAARQRSQQIKSEALSHLDQYLQQFELKVIERGGHVFWAENAEEARQYITGLATRHAFAS